MAGIFYFGLSVRLGSRRLFRTSTLKGKSWRPWLLKFRLGFGARGSGFEGVHRV